MAEGNLELSGYFKLRLKLQRVSCLVRSSFDSREVFASIENSAAQQYYWAIGCGMVAGIIQYELSWDTVVG